MILLPPSEGKFSPEDGSRLSMSSLTWPELDSARSEILSALVHFCAKSPKRAQAAIGVTAKQASLIEVNAQLRSAPTAAAVTVYSGVLYEAMDFGSLPAAARARATKRLAIASALWGLLRPEDHIPAYRFSADSRIPGLVPLSQIWSVAIGSVICAEPNLIIDLRSSAYQNLAPIPARCVQRSVNLRILQDRNGRLSVVSHHNKATKGRIVAGLLRVAKEPITVPGLIDVLHALGFLVQSGTASRTGVSVLDVIVKEL